MREAQDGDADADEDADAGAKVIDVTDALQCLVKDSQLVLQPTTKSELIGFYDPCIGEPKALRVRYRFRGRPHEVVVADGEALRIPMRSHLLQT